MRYLAACAVALFVGLAPPAGATSIRQLDLDTLVATADLILLGTAGEGQTITRKKRFVTLTPLVPERVVKGAADGSITVETFGGTQGVVGQKVAGTARFVDGEQVVVFLTRLESGHFRVRGMAQGKLTVVPGVAGGRAIRDLGGLRLVGADGATDGHDGQTVPLDVFLRDLAVRVVRDRGTMPAAPSILTPGATGQVNP